MLVFALVSYVSGALVGAMCSTIVAPFWLRVFLFFTFHSATCWLFLNQTSDFAFLTPGFILYLMWQFQLPFALWKLFMNQKQPRDDA